MIKSRMKWTGHIAHMGEKRHTYRALVRKPYGKRWPGRPRRTKEYNKKINLKYIGRVSFYLIWLRIGTIGGLV
jgi:hypothetical protein